MSGAARESRLVCIFSFLLHLFRRLGLSVAIAQAVTACILSGAVALPGRQDQPLSSSRASQSVNAPQEHLAPMQTKAGDELTVFLLQQ